MSQRYGPSRPLNVFPAPAQGTQHPARLVGHSTRSVGPDRSARPDKSAKANAGGVQRRPRRKVLTIQDAVDEAIARERAGLPFRHILPKVLGPDELPEEWDPALHPPSRVISDQVAAMGIPRFSYAEWDVITGHTLPPAESRALADRYAAKADAHLGNKKILQLGAKPEELGGAYNNPDEDVAFLPIPHDELQLRFYAGGTPRGRGDMFFDFFDMRNKRAVDKPPGYEIVQLEPAAAAEQTLQSLEQG